MADDGNVLYGLSMISEYFVDSLSTLFADIKEEFKLQDQEDHKVK